MKFEYFKFPLSASSDFFGQAILRPIIPLEVTYNDRSLGYAALIDSGADFCIFDAEIGEYLGIDIRAGKLEMFGGINDRGGAKAFLHEVMVGVGGWPYKMMVGFSYDIASHGFGVLGQKGFFDIFTVKFDLLKEEIELKPQV